MASGSVTETRTIFRVSEIDGCVLRFCLDGLMIFLVIRLCSVYFTGHNRV